MTAIVTIMMLLQLYDSIFKTLAYLILETYSKPSQIHMMIRHIKNAGINRILHLGIFKQNQGLITIIMLLQLYYSIFKTLAYLILEAYSKPCQIHKMIRHIKNVGINRTLHLGILKQNQGYSAVFSHLQTH